jgi:hypothetical protein
MNEAETRAGRIDPLLAASGWGVVAVAASCNSASPTPAIALA